MRYLTLLILGASFPASAQPFAIGSRSITFFDASRNRNIATNLYYPGVTAGSNAEVANGAFPLLVVGHGFVMSTDAYANLWNHFVPLGYIVALPTTESGFAPSHGNFGQDIAFIVTAMQAANNEASSPFFGHMAPTSALMGHSMGGGSSFLGAAGNTAITTVVNFAAAETNPSAVAACAQVLVPTLMFAGSNDCVTPIAQHTAPMYAALTMPCRAFVNITGGGHCYFAESDFNCSFGELTCSPAPAISRAQQHDVINDFATLWLDHFLKGDQGALASFVDSIALSTRAVSTTTCELPTGLSVAEPESSFLSPSIVDDRFQVNSANGPVHVQVFDLRGRTVMSLPGVGPGQFIDARSLPQGTYLVLVGTGAERMAERMIIAR
ncbi:MAG: T9SS type A sorting domain-containing protein [Flavobacteriales bacterium]|nr:T9SS type A sorting domain-containing protein [Flavobacteriales bacterium]